MARSRRFYESQLGLRPTSGSHNRGTEQSRLDAIRDDTVEVLALAPARSPPHLELLCYASGRDAAASTPDPAGIVRTRTIIAVRDLGAARAGLQIDIGLQEGFWEERPALSLHDPDGHALILCGSDPA